MDVETFISDSTQFFDDKISKAAKNLSSHGRTPKFTERGPNITIDGESYQWVVSLVALNANPSALPDAPAANQNPEMAHAITIQGEKVTQYIIGHKPDTHYDEGLKSIDDMFNSPEFVNHFKEINNG